MVKDNQRESIKQMVMKSKMSVERYKVHKNESKKNELKAKTEQEKQLIYKFEREA